MGKLVEVFVIRESLGTDETVCPVGLGDGSDLDPNEFVDAAVAKGWKEKTDEYFPMVYDPHHWKEIKRKQDITDPDKTIYAGHYDEIWWEAKTSGAKRFVDILNSIPENEWVEDPLANPYNEDEEFGELGNGQPDKPKRMMPHLYEWFEHQEKFDAAGLPTITGDDDAIAKRFGVQPARDDDDSDLSSPAGDDFEEV